MQRNHLPWNLIIGGLLVVAGLMFLLQNLVHVRFVTPLVWSTFFLAAALLFLTPWLRNRQHWWALIPAGGCASIAAVILLDLLPGIAGDIGGAIFLLGLALTFFAVYLFQRKNWWALIPSGLLALLGGIILISHLPLIPEEWRDTLQGVFFLGGLGCAFLIFYGTRREHWWAILPGGILTVLAVVPIAQRISWLNPWTPFILFAGIALVFLALHLSTHMRWSLWAALASGCFGVLVQLAAGPARISAMIFAVILIALGGLLLLRRRNGHQRV